MRETAAPATRRIRPSGFAAVIAPVAGPFAFDPGARSPFVFDLRAVGVFRILLAATILVDQVNLLGDFRAFHSAAGLVSAEDSRDWGSPWLWSLYWLSDGALLPVLLEALRFAASVALLFGIRSRVAAFVLFALLASVAARNPLPLQAGDTVLVVVTFFAAFLPLGERYSLARLWFGAPAPPLYRSAATAGYAVQVLLVFFMAGILKDGAAWWPDGTAVSMAVHMEAYATETARLWRHWDGLARTLTGLVFWLECLAPLLALAPAFWPRTVGVAALVVLEIGIFLTIEAGLFPLISLVSLVPLTPPRAVEAIARRLRPREGTSGAELVLFYDRPCRFCAFACRFLLALTGVRGAGMREAQSDPVAAEILERGFEWSVTERAALGREDAYRRGWAAVRFLVGRSPRPWLARLLPGAVTGARLYAWIGRNRGRFGTAGRLAFGRGDRVGWHGEAGRFVVACALTVVLAWNAATYPALRDRVDLRPLVEPLAASLNLLQYWNMFAPEPPAEDVWHALPALARDGERVDILSGRPVSLEPPRDGPARYGGYRWRKTIEKSQWRGEIDRVSVYFCDAGRWAALDIWQFARPNLGSAATADAPYEATRLGRWRCHGVDNHRVNAFQAEVDAEMAGAAGAAR